MRFSVEPMRLEHIPVVGTIEQRCFSQPWPPNAYRKEIQTNRMAHYFVARRVDDDLPRAEWRVGSGVTGFAFRPAPAWGSKGPHDHAAPPDDGILGKLARLFRGTVEEAPPASPTNESELRSIVGYAGLWLMTDEAHITTIAVDPDYQGRGIGELLLLGLIERARGINARWLTLEVRVSNAGAQALYRKYTFKEMGLRRRYYSDNGEDALVMWTDPIDSATFQNALRQNRDTLGRKLGQHD